MQSIYATVEGMTKCYEAVEPCKCIMYMHIDWHTGRRQPVTRYVWTVTRYVRQLRAMYGLHNVRQCIR